MSLFFVVVVVVLILLLSQQYRLIKCLLAQQGQELLSCILWRCMCLLSKTTKTTHVMGIHQPFVVMHMCLLVSWKFCVFCVFINLICCTAVCDVPLCVSLSRVQGGFPFVWPDGWGEDLLQPVWWCHAGPRTEPRQFGGAQGPGKPQVRRQASQTHHWHDNNQISSTSYIVIA